MKTLKVVKVVKGASIALFILLLGAQVFRPERTNPAVDEAKTIQSRLHVPANVDAILKRACYDCHSNQTRWPWYSNVAPVSWWLVDHVNHGRSHLNFSEWDQYDAKKAAHHLEEICEEVEAGAMPLPSYLPMHPQARLSAEEVRALCDWASAERQRAQ